MICWGAHHHQSPISRIRPYSSLLNPQTRLSCLLYFQTHLPQQPLPRSALRFPLLFGLPLRCRLRDPPPSRHSTSARREAPFLPLGSCNSRFISSHKGQGQCNIFFFFLVVNSTILLWPPARPLDSAYCLSLQVEARFTADSF